MHPAKKAPVFDDPSPLPLSHKMQQTLASLRLEGLIPDEASLRDIALFDAKEITKEEFLKRALARAKA